MWIHHLADGVVLAQANIYGSAVPQAASVAHLSHGVVLAQANIFDFITEKVNWVKSLLMTLIYIIPIGGCLLLLWNTKSHGRAFKWLFSVLVLIAGVVSIHTLTTMIANGLKS